METTMLIKLKKDVKEEASKIAGEIGIPMSTLISSFLKNFIREKKITLSAEPEISKKKMREWEKAVNDYKKNPSKYKSFNSVDALMKSLLD